MSSTSIPTLETQPRAKTGTRYARRLRAEGRLPVVIYGHGHDPIHRSVDGRAFSDFLQEGSQLVNVSVDGQSQACLLKEIQYDYLDREPLHIDLTLVNLDEQIETEVVLELVGESPATAQAGAVLDQKRNSVLVRCKARDIPEVVEHDIAALTADEPIRLSDLKLPEGVELVEAPELTVATITVVQEAPDPSEAGDVDPGEPELIGKNEQSEDNAGGTGVDELNH